MRDALRVFAFVLACGALSAQTSPNIGLALPPINSSNWGTKLNNNMTILDGLLSGNANVPGLHLSGNFQVPSQTSYSPLGGGLLGYDSTLNVYVGGNNSATIRFPYVIGSAPSGCAQWGANYALTGTGVACGAGGGGTPGGAFGSIQYNSAGSFGGLSLGTTTTVLHGNASGAATFGTVDLALDVTGNLGVAHLASGASASGSTFWRGDGVWATPAGGGNVSNTGTPTSGQLAIWNSSTVLQGITALPAANFPALVGDVTAPGASLSMTLAAVGSAGSCGDATHSCQLTFDSKGRETARANVSITGGGSSPNTTKGDLFGFSTVAARVPVGTDGLFLMADSTAALGVSYQPPFTIGPNGTLSYSGGVLDTDNGVIPRLTNSSDVLANWTYEIGQDWTKQASGSTPGAGKIHPYANTDNTPHYVTSDGIDHPWTGGGGSPVYSLGYASGSQTIPGSFTDTKIVFDTNQTSITTDLTIHSTSVNPDRFTAPATGWYGGVCSVGTSTSNNASSYISVFVNDTLEISRSGLGLSSAASPNGMGFVIPWSYKLPAGDYVNCHASLSDGWTTLAGQGATQFTFYAIH